MKIIICGECKQQIPLAHSYTYLGKSLCEPCIEPFLNNPNISKEEISKNVDLTICAHCGYDNGSENLTADSGMSLCDNCYQQTIHRPFPDWVKAFCAAIVIVVFLGIVIHARYFTAYFTMKEAISKFNNGEFDQATILSKKASVLVPENNELHAISMYYEGFHFVQLDEVKKALPLLENCTAYFPDDRNLRFTILSTKAGIAFDDHDYQSMYNTARELDSLFADIPTAVLYHASASACMYVITNLNTYKLESEKAMQFAQESSQDNDRKNNEQYIKCIRYRLENKKIITMKEYEKRFPAQKEVQ